ncbi:hypothetical protein PIB30_051855 [Stylosanthes scabra]|uniref:Transposase n=1 Tax=Stylosanthes scabra TaxID=79078 RepID=A0ABU6RII3_9FABA|nr:hypothetical protein [Stylosanthes scabra]
MTRGDCGPGTRDRGRGFGGRRGLPGRGQAYPSILGPFDPPPTQATTTPPLHVIPTPSLPEGLPMWRMIRSPGSRVPSSDTPGTQRHTLISAPSSSQQQVGDDNDAPSPPEPNPIPFPQLPILCWRGRRSILQRRRQPQPKLVGFTSIGMEGGYELKIYESWRQRATKRLQESFHEIRKKGALYGWIPENIFDWLVEFWQQENFRKMQWSDTKNQAFETSGSLHTGVSTTYPHTRQMMEAYEAEKKRLEAERQAIIDARGQSPLRSMQRRFRHGFSAAAKRGGYTKKACFLRILSPS